MLLDDGGDATLLVHLGIKAAQDPSRHRQADQRGGGSPLRRHRRPPQEEPRLVRRHRQEHPRRHRGDHHRRPPPLRDGQEGHAAVPRHQRERFRHQVEVRQSLRRAREPGRRHQARHRRDDGRQGRLRRRLWRRRQGQRRLAAQPGRARHGHGDRSDLRAAGRHGGLPGRDHGGCRARRRHLRHRHRQRRRHHHRPHARHEGPRHRLQHRPLRQRDPDRRPQQLQVGGGEAAGRRGRLPRRQAPDHPVQGPAGESRQRHRPSELRHERLLHQPGAGPDRAVAEPDQVREEGLRPAQAPRREGRRPPPRQGRRQAHQALGTSRPTTSASPPPAPSRPTTTGIELCIPPPLVGGGKGAGSRAGRRV